MKDDKSKAAQTLTDELFFIKDKLEKIHLLLGDVTEDYFHKYDHENKDDQFYILYGFRKNGHLTEMAETLTFEIHSMIKELEDKAKNKN